MKATLEFDLPEDQEAFDRAREGGTLFAAMTEFDQYLRSQIKYGDHPEPAEEAYAGARAMLWTILEERDLAL